MTLPGDGVHQLYMNMPRAGPSGFMQSLRDAADLRSLSTMALQELGCSGSRHTDLLG